jgi:hypothetical protein
MQDRLITADIKNADLARAYDDTCLTASNLDTRLTTRTRVSTGTFNRFKSALNYLFIITRNREEMQPYKEILTRTKTWLSEKHTRPASEYMTAGLSIFDEYDKAMRNSGLVNDKQR